MGNRTESGALNRSNGLALSALHVRLVGWHRTSGATGKSSDQVVLEMARSLQERMPKPLTRDEALADVFAPAPDGRPNSLAVVLMQEVGAWRHGMHA